MCAVLLLGGDFKGLNLLNQVALHTGCDCNKFQLICSRRGEDEASLAALLMPLLLHLAACTCHMNMLPSRKLFLGLCKPNFCSKFDDLTYYIQGLIWKEPYFKVEIDHLLLDEFIIIIKISHNSKINNGCSINLRYFVAACCLYALGRKLCKKHPPKSNI